MEVKFKRYLALLLLFLLSGCPPHHKVYQLVASDDQIEDIVLSESHDTYWMCQDDSCDLKFWFEMGQYNVGRRYWVDVVFKYSSDLDESASFALDSLSLKSTLFDFEFYNQVSYENIGGQKKSWKDFSGMTSQNMRVLRFKAYPKNRNKVIGDTLKLSGARVHIGDSIHSKLPELMFLSNETKSSFLGKKSR